MLFRSVSQSRYGGSGSNRFGVQVISGTIKSTGSGNMGITGVGGSGPDSNVGVRVENGATIETTDGLLSITGQATAATTGSGNSGITNAGTISATGGGSIELQGFSYSAGDYFNVGVLNGSTGTIETQNGNITIVGYGGINAFSNRNRGVSAGGSIESQGSGSISITGTAGGGYAQNDGVLAYGTVQTTSGDITIEGTGSLSTGSNNDGVEVVGGR